MSLDMFERLEPRCPAHDERLPCFLCARDGDALEAKHLAAWRMFRTDNPKVWELFESYALQAAHANVPIGAKAIWERLRWHVRVETRSEDGWKLNNNHTAYAARDFIAEHPEYGWLFETRKVSTDA